MRRDATRNTRTAELIAGFDHYTGVFDKAPPFSKFGQLEFHRETIAKRRELASAVAAINDVSYIETLLKTLRAWQIGTRASVLVSNAAFQANLGAHEAEIAALDALSIDDVGSADVEDAAWHLVEGLRITENEAKLVAHTKTLHHLMPELFVPIDRAFTGTFFGWQPVEFQSDQERVFRNCWKAFGRIAREAAPDRLADGVDWHTSPTKIIDNAIVGYCLSEGLVDKKRTASPRITSDGVPRREEWSLDDLRDDLQTFEAELRKVGLAENSITTYVGRSETFVRWLSGDYEPRGPNG